ncbi:hypothetical protein EXIGLDRAFT_339899 [Exidia glandulosa HHB12029]|uniref:Uncharacterized protein n=1 Tax=Exidia glandulosa HHB12029 TaxID=1314781 RepID=A0A165CJ06_EXIGL|nr:hypothetical protein EXIGLDRAFT_339899 [Exidia glandulosa HHB12029]
MSCCARRRGVRRRSEGDLFGYPKWTTPGLRPSVYATLVDGTCVPPSRVRVVPPSDSRRPIRRQWRYFPFSIFLVVANVTQSPEPIAPQRCICDHEVGTVSPLLGPAKSSWLKVILRRGATFPSLPVCDGSVAPLSWR